MDTPLFRAGRVVVTRGDVVRWAQRYDPTFVARTARRAALAAIDVEDDPSLEGEVEEAAKQFRYARDLESSEALIGWLTARGVSVESWWEAERVSVLERRFAGQEVPAAAEVDDADPDAADAQRAALVVTDLLDHARDALARRVAVARELSGDDAIDVTHDALEATWISWRATVLTEPALQQAVDRERLAWMVFELVQTSWENVEAAREAMACVRDDGTPLEDVARDARAPVETESRLLTDVPEALHNALLNAAAGTLVGPIEQPPRWTVTFVRAKRSPSLGDPLVRAAAELLVEARAVAPLVSQHIKWMAPRL